MRALRFAASTVIALGLVLAPMSAVQAKIVIKKIAFDPKGEDSLPEPNSDLNKEFVR